MDANRVYSVGGCEREGEPLNIICRLQSSVTVQRNRTTIFSVRLARKCARHPHGL